MAAAHCFKLCSLVYPAGLAAPRSVCSMGCPIAIPFAGVLPQAGLSLLLVIQLQPILCNFGLFNAERALLYQSAKSQITSSSSQNVACFLSMQCCVTSAEPATSLQTQTMGPARSGVRQGGQSGPQGMLTAEPSMPDQDGETSLVTYVLLLPDSITCHMRSSSFSSLHFSHTFFFSLTASLVTYVLLLPHSITCHIRSSPPSQHLLSHMFFFSLTASLVTCVLLLPHSISCHIRSSSCSVTMPMLVALSQWLA